MSKITIYNKLVRDKIPEIIEANGGKAKYRVIEDDEEFKKALTAKLVEEIDEFLNAKTEEEAIEELADIWTVAMYVDRMYQDRVRPAIQKKSREKGSFRNRIFLESVEFEEDGCEERS